MAESKSTLICMQHFFKPQNSEQSYQNEGFWNYFSLTAGQTLHRDPQ